MVKLYVNLKRLHQQPHVCLENPTANRAVPAVTQRSMSLEKKKEKKPVVHLYTLAHTHTHCLLLEQDATTRPVHRRDIEAQRVKANALTL